MFIISTAIIQRLLSESTPSSHFINQLDFVFNEMFNHSTAHFSIKLSFSY